MRLKIRTKYMYLQDLELNNLQYAIKINRIIIIFPLYDQQLTWGVG